MLRCRHVKLVMWLELKEIVLDRFQRVVVEDPDVPQEDRLLVDVDGLHDTVGCQQLEIGLVAQRRGHRLTLCNVFSGCENDAFPPGVRSPAPF